MKRWIPALIIILLCTLAFAYYFKQKNITHDDIILADMDRVIYDAQKVLYETGGLLSSIKQLQASLKRRYPNLQDFDVAYKRTGSQDLLLCGEFKNSSLGQESVPEFMDIRHKLHRDLTTVRPKKGHHCYEIKLETMNADVRYDELLSREINTAVTILECSYWATGKITGDLETAKKTRRTKSYRTACRTNTAFLGQTKQELEIEQSNAFAIKLCAKFRKAYAGMNQSQIFDPVLNSRYVELTEKRSNPGAHCYNINFLQPDPAMPQPLIPWKMPLGVENFPTKLKAMGKKDKRAIGDMVNLLRLARCSFSLTGDLPESYEQAVDVIAATPNAIARRYQCNWAPAYYQSQHNKPVATYETTGKDRIEVCANFIHKWESPLALHFFGRASQNWPTGLHELQRPVGGPGKHCFNVRLTMIGSGAY